MQLLMDNVAINNTNKIVKDKTFFKEAVHQQWEGKYA
jgi:hypothetical protein